MKELFELTKILYATLEHKKQKLDLSKGYTSGDVNNCLRHISILENAIASASQSATEHPELKSQIIANFNKDAELIFDEVNGLHNR